MASFDKGNSNFAGKLRRAVQHGDITTARRLIKGGIDINSTLWYDTSLLQEAVASDQLDMVKMLLRAKVDVDGRNKDGRTALHIVCRHGNKYMFEALIQAKAKINVRTRDGRTPLHVAIWRKHVELIRQLVDAGADVNAQDDDGWSPLHWAVSSELIPTTELLILRGARLNTCNRRGLSPLHESICKDNMDLIKMFVKHGADLQEEPKNSSLLSLSKAPRTQTLLLRLGYQPPTTHRVPIKHRETRGTPARSTGPGNQSEEAAPLTEEDARCQRQRSLCELCRTVIRRHLLVCHDHRSIKALTAQLGLPQVLKDYVDMKKELDSG